MFLHLSVILFTGGGGVHPPADTPLPGRQPPPPEMATAADGTHPTGMHSCFYLDWLVFWFNYDYLYSHLSLWEGTDLWK